MPQHQGLTGPVTVNTAAPFSEEMVEGYGPDRPYRPRDAWRQTGMAAHGQQPPAAPFSVEMSAGWHPDQPPITARQDWHIGRSLVTPDAPLGMIEQTAGYHPDTARLPFAAKSGLSVKGEYAPFASTVEMTYGYHPDQPVPWRQLWHEGRALQTPEVPAVLAETFANWHPDRPMLALIAGQGGTQVNVLIFAAPMLEAASLLPAQSRQVPIQRGPSFFPFSGTTTPSDFPEQFVGSLPDRARPALQHPQTPPLFTFVDPFGIEQTVGWHPDRGVFFRGPRTVGWQTPELSHAAAPFDWAMTYGNQPPLPKLFKAPEPHLPNVVTDRFSPESTWGWWPTTSRQGNTRNQQGWFTEELTHIAAPFDWAMTYGFQPTSPKLFKGPEPHLPNVVIITLFAFESTYGSQPPRKALGFKGPEPHLPNVVQIVAFAYESTYGWEPSIPVLPSTRNQQGWSQLELTHVPAPFSTEMAQGHQPPTPRLFPIVSVQLPPLSWVVEVPKVFQPWWVLTSQLVEASGAALPIGKVVVPPTPPIRNGWAQSGWIDTTLA